MGDGTKEGAQSPAYPYIPIIPSEMLQHASLNVHKSYQFYRYIHLIKNCHDTHYSALKQIHTNF
jgi:hypothetical protein